jgi:xanthine dehydrogenase molybdenum-binding subunit
LIPSNALTAKILHSTIASGVVKSIDISQAVAFPGMEKVLTYADVPQVRFSTVAHPLALDPAMAEVEDHLMLTSCVHYF